MGPVPEVSPFKVLIGLLYTRQEGQCRGHRGTGKPQLTAELWHQAIHANALWRIQPHPACVWPQCSYHMVCMRSLCALRPTRFDLPQITLIRVPIHQNIQPPANHQSTPPPSTQPHLELLRLKVGPPIEWRPRADTYEVEPCKQSRHLAGLEVGSAKPGPACI
jgi:hypothetical protein